MNRERHGAANYLYSGYLIREIQGMKTTESFKRLWNN